jgi:hypothetical protein
MANDRLQMLNKVRCCNQNAVRVFPVQQLNRALESIEKMSELPEPTRINDADLTL